MLDRGDPGGASRLETAFVGRTTELADLAAAVDDAVGGRGSAVFVGGEPGIGKTTLARRVAGYAQEREVDVLWCRCREGEPTPPYWPWIELLRAGLLRLAEEPLATLLLGSSAPEAAPSPPPPPSPSEDRLVLFDRFATRLATIARARPLLLVFDDLHGADRSSLSLLQLVVQRIAAARMLVVGLYRDVDLDREHPLSPFLAEVVRAPGARLVPLRGLEAADVRRFLEIGSGAAPPDGLADAVLRRTGGNPFFLKELVPLLLADHGLALDRDGGTHPLVPQTVREVIGRRLDALSPGCQEMLGLAAVIGPEFTLGVLQGLTELAREPLLDVLDEAIHARLVAATATPGRYAFPHALFRDTLYAGLPTVRRLRVHRRVGEILEQLHAPDPDGHLTELAFHFAAAAPGGDAAKAVAYALRAGRRAVAATAYEESVRCYESALASLALVAERDDATRCEVLLDLSDALWRSGSFHRARSTALAAFEIARALGAPTALARAALNVPGRALVFAGSPDPTAVAVLEEALRATGEREPGLSALLSAQLARELTLTAPPERLAALAEDAIGRARRTADPTVLASVLRTTFWPLSALRSVEERLLVAREIVALADRSGDQALALEGRAYAVLGHLEVGDRVAAVAELEGCTRTAEQLRQRHLLWLVTLVEGCWASGRGELDDFERLSRKALAFGQEDENPGALFFFGFQRCFLAMLRGRFAEAEEILLSHAGTFPLMMDSYRALLVMLHLFAGRPRDAREEFERFAAAGFCSLRRNILWTGVVTNLASACALLNDAPRAAELYALLAPHAGRLIAALVVSLGSMDRYLGQLATTMKRWAEAERHFEDALDLNQRMHQWLPLAFVQAEYAGMLIARGDPDDRARIEHLLADAWGGMERLGLTDLLAAVQMAPANGGRAVGDGGSRTTEVCLFQQEGEFWSVAYQGHVARLRHRKGFAYLARLLRHPEREFAALDLVLGDGPTVPSSRRAVPGDSGPALDRTARDQYRRRYGELQAELAEAERLNDSLRASRLREEAAVLAQQLAAAIGLGGRHRRAGSASERSRSTVTKGIRGAIRAIEQVDAALGRYLAMHVRTGRLCVYVPDLQHPVVFEDAPATPAAPRSR